MVLADRLPHLLLIGNQVSYPPAGAGGDPDLSSDGGPGGGVAGGGPIDPDAPAVVAVQWLQCVAGGTPAVRSGGVSSGFKIHREQVRGSARLGQC